MTRQPPALPSSSFRGVVLGAIAVALALAVGSCGRPPAPGPLPVRVVVSVAPQAQLVERLAGERAVVSVLVSAGGAPETFEPTPQQLVAVSEARLAVLVGHPALVFESRLRQALSAAAIVSMADSGAESTEAAAADPHLWLSPIVLRATARRIAAALEALDPPGGSRYREGLDDFERELTAVEGGVSLQLSGLEGRAVYFDHPAWGHFLRLFGIEQRAVERGGREPTPGELVGLIEEARQRGVRTVFARRGTSPRSARLLADEIGAEVVELDPLAGDVLANLRRAGTLFQEALIDRAPRRKPG